MLLECISRIQSGLRDAPCNCHPVVIGGKVCFKVLDARHWNGAIPAKRYTSYCSVCVVSLYFTGVSSTNCYTLFSSIPDFWRTRVSPRNSKQYSTSPRNNIPCHCSCGGCQKSLGCYFWANPRFSFLRECVCVSHAREAPQPPHPGKTTSTPTIRN